jgi:hypothetical protein
MYKRTLHDLVETTWRDANGDSLATVQILQDRYGFSLIQAVRAVCTVKHIQLEIKYSDGSSTNVSH